MVGGLWAVVEHRWDLLWIRELEGWIVGQYDRVSAADGRLARWGLRPLLWPYQGVARLAGRAGRRPVTSGVELAGWLYATGALAILLYLLVVVALALVAMLVALYVVFKLAELWLAGEQPQRVQQATPEERFDSMREWDRSFLGGGYPWIGDEQEPKLAAKFGGEFGRVDDDGKIYSSGAFPHQIGFIDDDGTIYDTRGQLREEVGEIDEDGQVE